MKDLYKQSARQMVELLRTRQVSPLEAIDASVARIEETDGHLNALPTLCLERARENAKKLMAEPPREPGRGQLYGLPIAVKDLVDVAGVRSTKGSPIYANRVPRESSYSVGILEANGAVVIGKSNTPEFGAGANTFNEVFGRPGTHGTPAPLAGVLRVGRRRLWPRGKSGWQREATLAAA